MADTLRIRAPEAQPGELRSFGRLFVANADRWPTKPALIDETGVLTWDQAVLLARKVAGGLAARGIGPGAMVSSLSRNSALHVVLYAATVIAGACMAPLPHGATPEALAAMRRNAGSALVFASDEDLETARTLGADVVPLSALRDWAEPFAPLDPVSVQPRDLFDMIYSSGTTGTPKGIEHDHLFRCRQFDRLQNWGLDGSAVTLASTPLYSNTTLVAVLPTLAWGDTLITTARFDCRRFLELAQAHRVSHAMLVPVQYRRLMDFDGFDAFDLSAFRVKLSTSAPLHAGLIGQVQSRWPGNLVSFYGLTEGGLSCVLDTDAMPDRWDTVGRPVPGCEVRVIDDAGSELPPGSTGELVGRAPSMMPGYHHAPDKTAEVLWRSPDGRDFLRTGDMGRIEPDGCITLLDRRKDVIISGGFNIFAADLEAVLLRHPAVADVAVIGVPSAVWGETPLALVVPVPGADTTGLLGWANERLGKTQRLSGLELRDALPRSDIGKVLKRELRAPYWQQEVRPA